MSAFSDAAADADKAKAAALAALARGGSAALDAYKAAQEQQAALKKQAATSALQRAAAIGATAAGEELAAGGHLAGTAEAAGGRSANQIFDVYAQDQARAGAARSQALADMAGQNTQYFNQLNAARPIVEGRAKAAWDAKEAARILAEQRAMQAELDRQAAREAREQAQAWRIEDRQMRLQDRASTRAEKAAKEMTPGSIINALGGQKVAGTVLRKAVGAQRKNVHERARDIGTFGLARRKDSTIANEIARSIGLPHGYGQALTGLTAPKPATPRQAAHRTDVTTRVQKYASRNTFDSFLDVVNGRPESEAEDGTVIPKIPPATSLAAAVARVQQVPDSAWRATGVSRDALVRWLTDYFRV